MIMNCQMEKEEKRCGYFNTTDNKTMWSATQHLIYNQHHHTVI
jgi:hypothetical protein